MSLLNSLEVPIYEGNGIEIISQQRKSIQNLNRFSSQGQIIVDDKMLEEFKKQEEQILKGYKNVNGTNEEYNDLSRRLQQLDVFKATDYQIVTEDEEDEEGASERNCATPSTTGSKTARILKKKVPKKLKLMKMAVMNSIRKHDKSELKPTNNRYSAEYALTGKTKEERKKNSGNGKKKKQEISNFLNSKVS